MSDDQPPHGVLRRDCGSCFGWTDFHPDGEISQVHDGACPEWMDCECGEPDCDECGESGGEHSDGDVLPDRAFALALRLLIGAAERDEEAVCLALDDIPECCGCDRQVWFALLRVMEMHSTSALADHLRVDLLDLLDSMEESGQ